MLFTTKWLSSLFPEYKGEAQSLIEIEQVTTDSRLKQKKSLFVPLVGANLDGHDFIKQAFNNGAVAALWNKERELPRFLPTDFPVFYVKDTLDALQQLAQVYRDKINPIVVGITGSNGKTTTKDIVASVLNTTFNTHFTQGNLNNHVGLPLTVLSMQKETEVLVLEMGMNNFNEIKRLSEIARPDYAIITNIGESHIEYLGSREGITEAKLEILSGMKNDGPLIIDGDEELLRLKNKYKNTVTCGFLLNNDVIIRKVHVSQHQTTFELSDGHTYDIPLLGKHHAKNAAYAISLGELLKIPVDSIKRGLSSLKLTSMRFELLQGKNGASIINDAYNASPTSMKASIEVVKQMNGFKEKVLVLGDIFELGEQSEAFHKSVVPVINAPISVVFTYGDKSKTISDTLREVNPQIVTKHFNSKDKLLHQLDDYLKVGTLILFKASRGMEFENIVKDVLH